MNRRYQVDREDDLLKVEPDNNSDVQIGARSWIALVAFVQRPQLTVLLPALLCSILAGLLQPAVAIFFGKLFHSLAEFGAGEIQGDELMARGSASISYLLAIGVISWIVKGGLFCLWLISSEIQTKAARDILFRALLRKDQKWYDMRINGIGSLLNRLQTYTQDLQTGTSQSLGLCCMYSVQAISSIGVSIYYCWRVTLVMLSTVPVVAVIVLFIQAGLPAAMAAQEVALDGALKIVHNSITNIVMIVCFNAQRTEESRYQRFVLTAADQYCKQVRINALEVGFSRFASTAVLLAGVYYGVILVHQEKATVQAVTTTFWSCMSASQAIEDILPHLALLRKSCSSVFALKIVVKDAQSRSDCLSPKGLCPNNLEGDIKVQQISFAYPSRPHYPILHDLTIFFPAGETTFVIGQSGSGKSTLGSILLKFHQPSKGNISIDGHNIKDLDTNWLRNNITLVQQQSVLFDGTLFQNIALGGRSDFHSELRHVERSLDFSMLSGDVPRLPDGVNTRVGTGGSTLSGGQRQRVALARAYFRNTPILILDESTSALDYISRTAFMQKLRDWRKGKTTIIITHDLTQVVATDFVYILGNGGIIAEGYYAAVSGAIGRNEQSNGVREHTKANQQITYNEAIVGSDRTSHMSNSSWSMKESRTALQPEDLFEDTDAHISVDNHATISTESAKQRATRNELTSKILHSSSTRARVPQWTSMSFVTRADIDKSRRSANSDAAINRMHVRQAYLNRTMSIHEAVLTRSLHTKAHEGTFVELRQLKLPTTNNHMMEGSSSNKTKSKHLNLRTITATFMNTLSASERLFLLAGLASATAHAVVPAALSFVMTKLFTTFYLQTNWQIELRKYSVSMFAIAVGDGVAFYFMHYLLELAGQRWVDRTRIKAFRHVIEQQIGWFEDIGTNSAYVSSVLDHNAEEMRNLVARFAAPLYVVTIVTAVSVIWALSKIWKLTLIALAAVLILYVVSKVFKYVSLTCERRANQNRDLVGAVFVETFTNIQTVRSLTLESYFHKKQTKLSEEALRIAIRRGIYCGIMYGLSDATTKFVTAAIFAYGVALATSGSYTVEAITAVCSLLLFGSASANAIVAYVPQVSSSVVAASRLLRLTQLPLNQHNYQHQADDLHNVPPSIEFNEVTFNYPSRPKAAALHTVTFKISPNSCTAIVGTSGSGKSTIASLLMGLYPITVIDGNGSAKVPISISGHDVRSIAPSTLRRYIALVPQTPVIIAGTIRENILYGDLDVHLQTEFNMQDAARAANIHEFIDNLPKGYDTIVGEGGIGMSGGQAQRIVIARSLARRPKILILDEATSALDWECAEVVRDSIKQLTKSARRGGFGGIGSSGHAMTVIVITHAKEMMEWADHVIVLKAGSVVEQGGYQELLRHRGDLWQMLNAGGVLGSSSRRGAGA